MMRMGEWGGGGQSDVVMEMPAVIGDYTDFYSSEYHAANCGRLFRPQGDSLPQNW